MPAKGFAGFTKEPARHVSFVISLRQTAPACRPSGNGRRLRQLWPNKSTNGAFSNLSEDRWAPARTRSLILIASNSGPKALMTKRTESSQERGQERACRVRPSRWLKDEILLRQEHCCLGCGQSLRYVEYDHVIPLSLGGSNNLDNWAALCPACHRNKTREDLRRLAKAKRQRRYHETGRSRAPSRFKPFSGAAPRGFDKDHTRHMNGTVTRRCRCPQCRPSHERQSDPDA